MPPDVNEGTLVVPCIMDMPPGKAPEDWSLPFRLKPAPADLTVVPVLEMPTPTVDLSTPLATPSAATTETYGIVVSLEKVIPLEDGYVLLGNLRASDERFSLAGDPFGFTVTDADGMQIPVQWDQADLPMTQTYDPSILPFAYRIQGKSFRGPLTLAFTSMSVYLNNPVRFSFDTGPNPAEGQSWKIDRELDILGIPVRLDSATMMDFNGTPAFELALQLPPALRSLQIGLEDSPGIWKTPVPTGSEGGGGGGGGGTGGFNAAGELLAYVFPDGQIVGGRINLTVYMADINGEWSTTWNPPIVAGAPTATPQPQACLTQAKWDTLSAAPSVPAGLGGTILTSRGAVAPNPSLFLSGLDGSGEKGLPFGDGSLSPDGGKSRLRRRGQPDVPLRRGERKVGAAHSARRDRGSPVVVAGREADCDESIPGK